MLEVLRADATLTAPSPMSPAQVVEALRLMLMSRAVDERLIKLQRMGRVGVYGPVHGQEAAVIGSAMALDPRRDWMVPASREHLAMVRHGLPLANLFATYMGSFDAAAIPNGVQLLPRQQSIGAQLPQAVGLAWALKLRKTGGVAAVYFGEGASSEGDFHEASNLAGVMRVPLVMLLINNRYAISTPLSKQTAAPELARRADGYGFRGCAVDGNDLLAMYAATIDAVNRARSGEGPTLIECRTYRMGFHNTSDNPKEYREETELAEAEQSDPIERVRRYATREGFWSAADEAAAIEEIRAQIDAGQKHVEAQPRPGAAAIFEHVYDTLSPRLQQQRSEAIDDAT